MGREALCVDHGDRWIVSGNWAVASARFLAADADLGASTERL